MSGLLHQLAVRRVCPMCHLAKWNAVAMVFLLAGPLAAQTDLSTIRGNVQDTSGAVVAGAAVSLTNVQTGLERRTPTGGSGDYEFPDLRRGTYRLVVSNSGFRNFVAENIILESNQIRRIDATLEVGQLEAEVKVTANAAVIETDTAKVQSGFTHERYDNFPIVGVISTPTR